MKNTIFTLLLVCSLFAHLAAQTENIVESYEDILVVNDTTLLLRTFEVYDFDTGYLDTVLVPPSRLLDSVGLVDYVFTKATNDQIRQAAHFRKAMEWRRSLGAVNAASSVIDQFTGGESDFYEEAANRWLNHYAGRYRIISDTLNFTATMELTPNGRRLRLVGENSEGTFLVLPYTRWSFKVNGIDGVNNYYMFWNGANPTKPQYRPAEYVLPSAVLPNQNRLRITKIQ